jgi:hypothetical protein
MPTKKRNVRTRSRVAAVASPLARRAPLTVYLPSDGGAGGEELYVRLPLAPHVVTAFQEHAANGARLLELVTGTETAAAEIFAHIAKAAAALERDLVKVRKRLARRRR